MASNKGQDPLAVQIINALTRLVNAIVDGGFLLWTLIIIVILIIADPSTAREIAESLF